jgi:hypothetical protein
MRVDPYATTGGGPGWVTTGAPQVPGRIDVKERALRKVSQQASAELIGVGRGDVSVDVAEYRDGYALRLSTPLPVPDLDDSAAVARATSITERAQQLQEQLSHRLGVLLGRPVVRVAITITGARRLEKRRVR